MYCATYLIINGTLEFWMLYRCGVTDGLSSSFKTKVRLQQSRMHHLPIHRRMVWIHETWVEGADFMVMQESLIVSANNQVNLYIKYSLSWFQIRRMVEALPWPQAHLRFLWQMDVPEVQAKSTFFVVPAFWKLRSNDIEKRI